MHRPVHGAYEPHPRGGPGQPDAPDRARGHHLANCRGGGRRWFVLSAGSGVDENQHHRWQRGREFRWLAWAQIRHHPQLCDGPRGGAARRRNSFYGQQVREGCGWVFAQGSFHRQRRDLRGDHPDPLATDSATGGHAVAGGHLRCDGRRGSDGVRHHRRQDHSLHFGVSRPHHPPLRGRLRQDRVARLRGAAVDGDRRASGSGG